MALDASSKPSRVSHTKVPSREKSGFFSSAGQTSLSLGKTGCSGLNAFVHARAEYRVCSTAGPAKANPTLMHSRVTPQTHDQRQNANGHESNALALTLS